MPAVDGRIDEVLYGGRAGVAHNATRQVFRRHAGRVELFPHRVDNQHDPGHRGHERVQFLVTPVKCSACDFTAKAGHIGYRDTIIRVAG